MTALFEDATYLHCGKLKAFPYGDGLAVCRSPFDDRKWHLMENNESHALVDAMFHENPEPTLAEIKAAANAQFGEA